MPDESTILRFRHWLEKHKLAHQILATINDLLIERGFAAQDRHRGGRVWRCRLSGHPTNALMPSQA
jgi:IS5 family transposase